MGIFKKFRSSSSRNFPADSSPPSTPIASITSHDLSPIGSPTTPKTSSYYGSANSKSSLGPSSFPKASPSSPGGSSVTSKLSKRRWRNNSKVEKRDALVGVPYESMVMAGPVTSRPYVGDFGQTGFPRYQVNGNLHPGGLAQEPIPPTSKRLPLLPDENEGPDSLHGSHLDSDSQSHVGGILGQLGFEVSPVSPIDKNSSRDRRSWMSDISVVQSPSDGMAPGSPTQTTTEDGTSQTQDKSVAEGINEMEVLDSSEKKGKLWKGKGRLRRLSRASQIQSDELAEAETLSPTPRKLPLPPVMTSNNGPSNPSSSAELHHPRPLNIRRPSSSFFQNAFHRSASRTSFVQDIEIPTDAVDDGSFQLKAFRHVSGTSEAGDHGGMSRYLSHLQQDVVQDEDTTSHTPEPAPPAPPISYFNTARPRPGTTGTRPPVSRPPSVAGSMTSMDEFFASSGKITAAAFRKKIRRPSEMGSPVTPAEQTDDDDDAPLAIRARNRVLSNPTMPAPDMILRPSMARAQTEAPKAGNPAKLTARPPSVYDRSQSVSPAPSSVLPDRGEDRRPPSRGFVVKGSTSTRQERAAQADMRSSLGRPSSFESRESAKPTTPQSQALVRSATGEHRQTPKDLHDLELALSVPLPGLDQSFGSYRPSPSPPPSTTSHKISPSRPAPPVEPINLPGPEDLTPKSLDLPLPPDQMPETPPPLNALPSRPSSRNDASPHSALLESPLKVIAGFWEMSSPSSIKSILQAETPKRAIPKTGTFPLELSAQSSFNEMGGFEEITRRVHDRRYKQSKEVNEEDSLNSWLVNSDALLGDQDEGNNFERKPSRLTLFDAESRSESQSRASLARDPSTSSSNFSQGTRPRPRPRVSSSTSQLSMSGFVTSSKPLQVAKSSEQMQEVLSNGQVQHGQAQDHDHSPPTPRRQLDRPNTSQSRRTLGWSSSESSEAEEEPVQRSPISRRGPRQVPRGPRKPSNPRAPPSTRSVKPPAAPKQHVNSLAGLEKRVESSSSEDEALSVLRKKASQSSLSINSFGKSPWTASGNVALPPIDKDRSIETTTRRTSSNGNLVPFGLPLDEGQSPHPFRGDISHRSVPSTESSGSARTSENLSQKIVTPRDDSSRGFADHDSDRKAATIRSRHLSMPTEQFTGMPPMSPLLGPPPPPNMDPQTYHTLVKQAWQAQYMAAAYRASEEEWERASSIHGTTDQTSSTTQPVPPFPFTPNFGTPAYGIPPMPYSVHPSLSQGGMAYPYLLPGPPSFPMSPGSESGGYAFGPSPQSVFGGEFGPPLPNRTPYPSVWQPPPIGSPHPLIAASPLQSARHGSFPRDSVHKGSTRPEDQFADAQTPRRDRTRSSLHHPN